MLKVKPEFGFEMTAEASGVSGLKRFPFLNPCARKASFPLPITRTVAFFCFHFLKRHKENEVSGGQPPPARVAAFGP
jgi:hypothetical protein